MKKLFWILPALMLVNWSAPAKTVDRILAQVNNDIITLSDLNRAMAQVRQELAARYTGEQLEQQVKKAEEETLENLIRKKLLLLKADELGFDANADVMVSSYIQQIIKDNNLKDTNELEDILIQQGTTLNDYRDLLRDEVIAQGMIDEFVRSRITILTQEIEKYYNNNVREFTIPEEVSLSEIVIAGKASDSEAEARAKDIYQRLKQGESFTALANQYSQGFTASKGGSIGSYVITELNPEIVKVIKDVEEGDVSGIQKVQEGYVIYRVDTRKPASIQPLDQVRDQIRAKIWDQKFSPEYDRFIAQLKDEAYIKIFEEIEEEP